MTKIEEMKTFCEANNFFWFVDLVDYAANRRKDWLRTLATDKGTLIMSHYLANKAYSTNIIDKGCYDDLTKDDRDDLLYIYEKKRISFEEYKALAEEIVSRGESGNDN